MKPIFVYITCKDRTEALSIGKTVIQNRLAACANIQDGMDAVYWWEGKVETAKEAILVLKSVDSKFEALAEMVKANHSYTLPCIIALPIENGNPDYLTWIQTEVSAGE